MASSQLSGAACAGIIQSRIAPGGAATGSEVRPSVASSSHSSLPQSSSFLKTSQAQTSSSLKAAPSQSSSSFKALSSRVSGVSPRRLPSFAASVASDTTTALEAAPSDVAGQRSSTSAASSPVWSPGGDGDGSHSQSFAKSYVELIATAKVVPHPDKVEKGGEDAFLISRRGAGIICVADGVGGWVHEGVDPALYSHQLLGNLQAAIDSARVQDDLKPQELLTRAHAATTAPGASTAVVAVLDGERSALSICNVGDSGVLIVREGEVAFRTRSQQHFFNCPFQLALEEADSPRDAEMYSVPVEEGDTIVMGSDGLFDNVFDNDIASIVDVFGGSDDGAPLRSATALAALASKHALDPVYVCPYMLEAKEQGKEVPPGGKIDDITVLVAVVVKAGSVGRT